ncbi:MAG: hypothetical protein HQ526_04620 [Actinobacteria bacterium]|nr:hypothetical protein [Actinomycetota bacterium]
MKRHPIEYLSLISGISFLAFAIANLVASAVGATPAIAVTFSLLIVGLCIAGIAAAVASQHRQGVAAAREGGDPSST